MTAPDCQRFRIFSTNWRSPAATLAGSFACRGLPKESASLATCGRACSSREWSRTSPDSARSSTSEFTRTASFTSPNWNSADIQDPSEVVAVGDTVRVKVLHVNVERRRISLSRKQATP